MHRRKASGPSSSPPSIYLPTYLSVCLSERLTGHVLPCSAGMRRFAKIATTSGKPPGAESLLQVCHCGMDEQLVKAYPAGHLRGASRWSTLRDSCNQCKSWKNANPRFFQCTGFVRGRGASTFPLMSHPEHWLLQLPPRSQAHVKCL